MYQVDNFNYAEQCNELMIIIDNSVELMTLLCLAILTQLVNYVLAPHNTGNMKTPSIKRPDSPQKPLLHVETVSLSN